MDSRSVRRRQDPAGAQGRGQSSAIPPPTQAQSRNLRYRRRTSDGRWNASKENTHWSNPRDRDRHRPAYRTTATRPGIAPRFRSSGPFFCLLRSGLTAGTRLMSLLTSPAQGCESGSSAQGADPRERISPPSPPPAPLPHSALLSRSPGILEVKATAGDRCRGWPAPAPRGCRRRSR